MNNFFKSKLLDSCSIQGKFFTRNGGFSTGRFSSLNFAGKFGDIHIPKNKEVVAKSFGVESLRIKLVNQVHSNDVVVIDESNANYDLSSTKADAMVTKVPGVVLAVLTADCCPVLLADPVSKIIGCAHAGWKGAFSGVIESTIDAMIAFGANKKSIIAAIGPSISWGSYEVDAAFKIQFLEQSTDNEVFFKPSANQGHYFFNLKAYAKNRATQKGLTQVEDLEIDTYTQSENFFSCRRAYHKGEKGFGNQLSGICL
ncbi:MAG: polyphenol oxidase [Candidatus Midichloriaceae bacterium]|jgi:YfiH family protein|nr:polyphenol oxidase [Candidatus Midichloriaceae bacterium]